VNISSLLDLLARTKRGQGFQSSRGNADNKIFGNVGFCEVLGRLEFSWGRVFWPEGLAIILGARIRINSTDCSETRDLFLEGVSGGRAWNRAWLDL